MIIVLGRFVSVSRTSEAFLAGINKMGWVRFLLFTVVARNCKTIPFLYPMGNCFVVRYRLCSLSSMRQSRFFTKRRDDNIKRKLRI